MRDALLALTILPSLSLLSVSKADEVSPDRAAGTKHLLLDSRIIHTTEGVILQLGRIEKDPRNPLFGEEKPWEVRYDNLYPNVMFDSKAGLYKCWYSPFIVDEATSTATDAIRKKMSYCARLAQVRRREMAVCYATSQDGIRWEKPLLGICDFEGSGENNLVQRNVHGAGVLRDMRDPDPARRYKMFFKRETMAVSFSPDGLHWSAVTPCPEIDVAGDTHNNAFWDARSGRYVGITRMWADGQRVVARTESRDFVHWSKAREVLRGQERHLQVYAMPVFPYAGIYLGLAMILNTRTDLVDCELAWSPDTIRWHRVCPGTPFIPRGAAGTYDAGCIYAAARPVARGNQIRIYYGGNDAQHCGWRKGYLCLARLRADGFAGMETVESNRPGTIVTRPIRCTGSTLRVSADVRGGSLRVAIVGADGFSLEACRPITQDATDAVVQWSDAHDLSGLMGRTVRLKFHLRRARLYAFSFTKAAENPAHGLQRPER